MNPRTWNTLEEQFVKFPITVAKEAPGEDEISAAASIIGCRFHDDYVAFLRRFGAAMVGSLPVFGLRPVEVMGEEWWSVVKVTMWFREQGWPGVDEWYVISDDGFGNPVGVAPDGKVMISDHNSGQISVLASDFEDFLLRHCLKSP